MLILQLKNKIVVILSCILFNSCELAKEQDIQPTESVEQVATDNEEGKLPNIYGQTPSGDSINIRSIHSKYILLEFWASWCPPCRQSNPGLLSVYEKYNLKGFEIFSISLDNDLSKWKNAIEKDKLKWPYHISDLKGWSSPLAVQYGIQSIPNNILFDENGKILAKSLEPNQLDNTLEKLFNK